MNAEKLVAGAVAAGRVEHPARGAAYDRLNIFVGKWITDGQTAPAPRQPSMRISASDIYEWATGGFFIVHTAYGTIGGMPAGGVEIIGYDAEKEVYRSQFFDSQGNHISEELSYRGEGHWQWSGARVRCRGRFSEMARSNWPNTRDPRTGSRGFRRWRSRYRRCELGTGQIGVILYAKSRLRIVSIRLFSGGVSL